MFAPGGYAYAEMKLNREWSTGFLYDNAPSLASPGKKTQSYSPFVTWNLSEFNRLRFHTATDDKVREERQRQSIFPNGPRFGATRMVCTVNDGS
jgi:hypothetical protein